MNRRAFLHGAGAGSMAALVGPGAPAGANDRGPFLDEERLRARNSNRSTVTAQGGMVCTSQPLASMAGIDVLKAGGNCIDAAIAANAVLGVTEPASNGIGGDLFAILWSQKEGRLFGLNASGRAPYAWTLEKAHERGLDKIPGRSTLAWSVPGCVSGWEALSERFGALPLGKCLDPAIHYASEGFPVSPIIAGHFVWAEELPGLTDVYRPGGRTPGFGDVFKNPALADSYRAIARDGARAFYEGSIAERIVAKAKELDGFMSLKDLADHEATWVDPVSARYRGWDVWEIPPNGQGIAALQILNLLEHFDIGSLEPNSPEHLHLFVEAKKLAFEDRAQYYADPEFADVPVDWLISKEYAAERVKLIDPTKARTRVTHGDPTLDSDTIYLAAADAEGNMISFIQSLYNAYGSAICPDGTGFPIQNRGQAFSLDPEHRNRLEPHKRPFHTIIPAFLTRDDRPVMAFGVMGGDHQPQGHAQVLMNMVDFGMSPQQAGDQPRVSHFGSSAPWGAKSTDGGSLGLERRIPDGVKAGLEAMGHRIREEVEAFGGYQAIWRRDDPLVYFGGSDPRKDGAALGY